MTFMGSIQGNILGILYFTLYQLLGIYCMIRLLSKKEGLGFSFLIGSVFGTISLQWLPALLAFFTGFTILGHMIALALFFIVTLAIHFKTVTSPLNLTMPKPNKAILVIMGITFLYFIYLLYTHTLLYKDGNYYTGQATFGDMHMHLGFITSIATQGTFPPEYSILPGHKLSYPFLCDSISSSLYLFGSSLKVAYNVPMYVAILQVMTGFYCFMHSWLKSSAKALIAWILFFWNGGLGFIYFFDLEKFKRIFTDFYFTPTSLGDENIRWAQVIVNMLLPQRATLFGWAILFPLLWLLYKALKKQEKSYFVLAGILAGALPMVHTHSFLALGLICTMWLLYDLKHKLNIPSHSNGLRYSIVLLLAFFTVYQLLLTANSSLSQYGIVIMGIGLTLLIVYIVYLLSKAVKNKLLFSLLTTWGVFLLLVVLLAFPQLFIWTFQQSSGDGFVRSHFNWSNTGDPYLWFYIKNLGIPALLLLPAWFCSKTDKLQVASPMLLILFIAELTVFQPNVYDNNKLLFVGALFLCGIVANYVVDVTYKLKKRSTILILGILLFFFSTISAFLTMGREYVSRYEVYNSTQIALSEYIESALEPDATILTNNRHTNAVSALTGRNIVCGSSSYLFYHGLDYSQAEQDLQRMYENPNATELLEQYQVDYILIGPEERNSYPNLDEDTIRSQYECVFEQENVALFKINN